MRYIAQCIEQFKERLATAGYENEVSCSYEFIEGQVIPLVTGRIAIYKYAYRDDEALDRMTPVTDITLTEVDPQGTVEVVIEASLPISLVKLDPPELLRAASTILDQEPAFNIHQRYSRQSVNDQVSIAIDSIYVLEWSWEMSVPSLSEGDAQALTSTDAMMFRFDIAGIMEEVKQIFSLAVDPTA